MDVIDKEGYLRIEGMEDRIHVATILYANGYTVSPVRRKYGKSYIYYLHYEKRPMDLMEDKPE